MFFYTNLQLEVWFNVGVSETQLANANIQNDVIPTSTAYVWRNISGAMKQIVLAIDIIFFYLGKSVPVPLQVPRHWKHTC